MKSLRSIALLLVAACLAVVVFVSIRHGAPKVNTTTVHADAPTLGPASTFCVWGYSNERDLKGHRNCVTLQIGMDEATVSKTFDVPHLPKMETETTAEGTIEYWHYFGSIEHEQWVTLTFVNGRLAAIQN